MKIKTKKEKPIEVDDGMVLLVVKAYPNYEKKRPEFDWFFPNPVPTTRMIGVLEMVKHDLLVGMEGLDGEYEEEGDKG